MAQSGFFIIINILRIYNSCSLPPLDQDCTATAILSCTTHSNTTSWTSKNTIYSSTISTAALFSLISSAKGHYSQNSGQAGHQEHGQLPAVVKNHWGLGSSEGKHSEGKIHVSRGHIGMLPDKLVAQTGWKQSRKGRETNLSAFQCVMKTSPRKGNMLLISLCNFSLMSETTWAYFKICLYLFPGFPHNTVKILNG